MEFQVFFTFSALMQAMIKRESKPTTTRISALDLKWFSIHMGEEWTLSMMIGLHQAINWTSHCYESNELDSIDYPLL